jgi:two-component system OmpR family sensor kinase
VIVARIPIRLRLTAGFAAAMAAVLVATGVFLHVRLAAALDDALDTALRARAQDVASLARESESGLSGGIETGLVEQGESYAQIIDTDGTVLDTTPQLGTTPILDRQELRDAAGGPITVDREPFGVSDDPSRVLALPVDVDGRTVVVAVGATTDPRNEALAGLRTQLLVGGPLALLLASLVGYGLAAAALRPVDAMRRRAAGISGGTGDRLPVSIADDELRRLGTTLNAMLDRIDETLVRERRFVADASHELRTPLALLRTELELASRPQRTRDQLVSALGSASEEVERLCTLAEDLLVLARSDDGELPLRIETLDASQLLEDTSVRFRARAEAGGRSLTITGGRATIEGDALRLQQALGNLVANALRYGDGAIILSIRAAGETTELHVTDEGPGFPPDFLPRAFDRFSRADGARGRGGTGLGLAIVDMIARAHEGTAGAANRLGGGADVWLSLALHVGQQAHPDAPSAPRSI